MMYAIMYYGNSKTHNIFSADENFTMSDGHHLSAGESAIYDRQIRLWGTNAQVRIKSSNILFIGMTPATVEIAKNAILAGCGILVEDDRHVNDSTTNFLIQLEINDPTGMLLTSVCK
jgi:ubiquitin-like 1-activating enzyme E1 A